MNQRILLLLVSISASACIARYPDSAYLSAAVAADATGDTGGGGTDASSGTPDIAGGPLAKSAFVNCLQTNCPTQLSSCLADKGCLGTLTCIVVCPSGGETCQSNCMATGGQTFGTLAMCGNSVCQP